MRIISSTHPGHARVSRASLSISNRPKCSEVCGKICSEHYLPGLPKWQTDCFAYVSGLRRAHDKSGGHCGTRYTLERCCCRADVSGPQAKARALYVAPYT